MPSATLFLPRVITVLMNFATCLSPYLGSGSPSLFLTSPLRGMIPSLLRLLRAVFGPALAPLLHADRIERAADQHHRVLLQVVANAGNVGRHLDAVGEPDARDFAQRRVRLLRRRRVDADANAALLRTSLQRRRGVFSPLFLASFTDELTDRGHNFTRFS